MHTALTKRLYWIVALIALLALAAAAVTLTARFAFAGGSDNQAAAQLCDDESEADDAAEDGVEEAEDSDDAECEDEDESGDTDKSNTKEDDDDDNQVHAASGQLDDGAGLLPRAGITLEQAIAAAQSAASGGVGEVDLEDYQGKLVFNVDVGNKDVKVDAATGNVLAVTADD